MHPAVPVCYRDEWGNDEMGDAFTTAGLDQYYRDGTAYFKIQVLWNCPSSLHRLKQKLMKVLIHAMYAVATKRCPTYFLQKLKS